MNGWFLGYLQGKTVDVCVHLLYLLVMTSALDRK